MASRNAFPAKNLHPETFTINCSFAPNGSSAVASSSYEGPIGSVSRTGVGTFLVTFTDKWLGLLSAVATLQLSAAADSVVQLGDYTAASKTLVVRVLTAGSAADVAADANNRIHLALTFRNTSLTVKA